MAKVIQLKMFEKTEPAAEAELQEQTADSADDDGDDAMDMMNTNNKAHGICGALSTIDVIDIEPSDFWKAIPPGPNRDLTIQWLTKSVRTLLALQTWDEFEKRPESDRNTELFYHLDCLKTVFAALTANSGDPALMGLAAMHAGHDIVEHSMGRKQAATWARCLSYASDDEMELLMDKEIDVANELRAQG